MADSSVEKRSVLRQPAVVAAIIGGLFLVGATLIGIYLDGGGDGPRNGEDGSPADESRAPPGAPSIAAACQDVVSPWTGAQPNSSSYRVGLRLASSEGGDFTNPSVPDGGLWLVGSEDFHIALRPFVLRGPATGNSVACIEVSTVEGTVQGKRVEDLDLVRLAVFMLSPGETRSFASPDKAGDLLLKCIGIIDRP